ncbi:DUF1707 SHOCT-like domain-containing protein [Solicola gregarius]|uniref:DUF1707 domain-containing protein n=1 Tax=Solicola gregarius TaxID=2908642 RepID=A0AA46THZ2_9ACTN|nr:DUF1707 domain-containing protein [Solicola gregarius]UYM04853.1 DUF1707 domain-containing protein [Solicola gregarius]
MSAQSSDGSDGTRARDADRNLAIELIDAAYSDGQLTTTEREDRCARVLAAETLGQLRALTGDLQLPLVAAPRRRRRRLVPIVMAGVVAVGIVGAVVIGTGDDPATPPQEVPSAAPQRSEPEPRQEPDPPKEKPKVLHYTLTPRGIENFVTAYRKQFGTTKALAFGFDRDSVNVVRKGRKPALWRYVDDRFLDSGYSTRQFEPGQIDITDLNVKAAFRNLERIQDRLGFEKFPQLGISVVIASGQKGAWLVAGKESTNLSECQGDWMTLDGEVRERRTACPES